MHSCGKLQRVGIDNSVEAGKLVSGLRCSRIEVVLFSATACRWREGLDVGVCSAFCLLVELCGQLLASIAMYPVNPLSRAMTS